MLLPNDNTENNNPPTQDEGHDVTPVDNGEATDAAYVKITTTPDGPTFTASVPVEEAGQLFKTLNLASGIGGSVISPFVMARALDMVGEAMPWQVRAFLLFLASLLPLIYYWLTDRHSGR